MKKTYFTAVFILFLVLHAHSQNDSINNSSPPLVPKDLIDNLSKLSSDSCFCDDPSWYSIKLDSTGNITDVSLIRGASECLDKKIQRIIWKSSPWTPAYKDGQSVPYIFTLPVIFKTPISQPCE